MTPQQIIPGKRYRHSDHPETIYEGRGHTDRDTLDCTNKKMVRLVAIDDRIEDRWIMPPFGPGAIPGFWDKFFPIND
jgi:hypothetical protein